VGQRILITDATERLGKELARALAGEGATVVGGTTTLAKAAGLEADGIEPAVIDFGDRASLAAAMRRADTVFLSVPLAETMGEWAANAIGVARASGVRHLVRSSVTGADVNVAFRLGRAHGMVDQLAAESGIPCTILRASPLMQDYASHLGPGIRDRGLIELPQGDGRLSLVDVRDAARAAAVVVTNPIPHWNHAYDLTGPDALSNAEVASTISDITGRTVRYASRPDADVRRDMLRAGLPEWNVEALMSLHAHVRAGGAAAVTSDVERITGSAPRSFADFAREHAGSW
jgi:uncharacterized protein YbjT (DUF2867 family)